MNIGLPDNLLFESRISLNLKASDCSEINFNEANDFFSNPGFNPHELQYSDFCRFTLVRTVIKSFGT